MIFRRIKAHVAKEDWFAVFIDFLIVVFGVFMGFQVQAWNENRGDQRNISLHWKDWLKRRRLILSSWITFRSIP